MHSGVAKKIAQNEPANAEGLPDEQATRFQKQALRRLDQLLDAIKTETDGMAKRAAGGAQQGGGPVSEGDPPAGGGDDSLPPLGQLKLLRALQGEVNQAIEEFGKKHPKLDKLDEKEKAEYQRIRDDQREIMKLLEALRETDAAVPGAKEGDKQ
jgi:hypothetical protein